MSGLNGEEQIGLSRYWEECAGSDKPMLAAVIPETIGKPTLAVLKVRSNVLARAHCRHVLVQNTALCHA